VVVLPDMPLHLPRIPAGALTAAGDAFGHPALYALVEDSLKRLARLDRRSWAVVTLFPGFNSAGTTSQVVLHHAPYKLRETSAMLIPQQTFWAIAGCLPD